MSCLPPGVKGQPAVTPGNQTWPSPADSPAGFIPPLITATAGQDRAEAERDENSAQVLCVRSRCPQRRSVSALVSSVHWRPCHALNLRSFALTWSPRQLTWVPADPPRCWARCAQRSLHACPAPARLGIAGLTFSGLFPNSEWRGAHPSSWLWLCASLPRAALLCPSLLETCLAGQRDFHGLAHLVGLFGCVWVFSHRE